jgi:hypothetical protein
VKLWQSEATATKQRRSTYTGLGVGSIWQPPLLKFLAPLERNVVWTMLWGTRYRGGLVANYNLFFFILSGILIILRPNLGIMLLIAFINAISPVVKFNDYLKEQSQLTELRLVPLTSRDYHDAILRYSLLFLTPVIILGTFTTIRMTQMTENLLYGKYGACGVSYVYASRHRVLRGQSYGAICCVV